MAVPATPGRALRIHDLVSTRGSRANLRLSDEETGAALTIHVTVRGMLRRRCPSGSQTKPGGRRSGCPSLVKLACHPCHRRCASSGRRALCCLVDRISKRSMRSPSAWRGDCVAQGGLPNASRGSPGSKCRPSSMGDCNGGGHRTRQIPARHDPCRLLDDSFLVPAVHPSGGGTRIAQ